MTTSCSLQLIKCTGKLSFSALIITGMDSTGWSVKCCFDRSNKEFLERGRVKGMVTMVFTLAGIVTGSVLII